MIIEIGCLRKMYADLLNKVDENIVTYPFFLQVGREYYNANKKILFVGKSVNGWITNSKDVDKLFGDDEKYQIVNRKDQLKWVNDLASSKDYNTNKSSFWRLIRGVSIEVLNSSNWYDYIAWSNLYKLSPSKGNPNNALQRLQREDCVTILNEEIKLLNPDLVVFLTSGWEEFYTSSLNLTQICEENWNGKYKLKSTYYNGIKMIFSVHPQGKPEEKHKEILLKHIKDYK